MELTRARAIIAALVAIPGLFAVGWVASPDDPEVGSLCIEADAVKLDQANGWDPTFRLGGNRERTASLLAGDDVLAAVQVDCPPLPDETSTTTTSTTSTTTTSTTTSTTTTTTSTTTPPEVETDVTHFCDFADPCPLDQFVQYRDRFVAELPAGEFDHAPMAGGVDWCTNPFTTRPWLREKPQQMTYRCVPMGNPDLAHKMSGSPHTTGYSFNASSHPYVYAGVTRIEFTVNMTSAGARNFWEVAVIPADQAWVDGMPCIPDVPCNAGYDYDDLGAYGFGNMHGSGSGFMVADPATPDGYRFDDRGRESLPNGDQVLNRCDPSADYCRAARIQVGQQSVVDRYRVVIEDRPDGLWFGQEESDGRMVWAALPGEHLPAGPVRVVLKFHGYTPIKSGNGPGYDGNESPSVNGFTWHWDDFGVTASSAVPSADFYAADPVEDRFVTSGFGPYCVAFAEGQRGDTNPNSGVAPVIVCDDDEAY